MQFALHFVGNETHFPYFLQIASLMTQQRKIQKTSFLREIHPIIILKAHFYPNLISSKYPDFIFVGNETHFSYFFQIASLMTQQLEKRM